MTMGGQRAQAQALQHARDADGLEAEAGDEVEQQADADDDQRPAPGGEQQRGLVRARLGAAREADRHGHAADEHEEREHPVGEGPAMPLGMQQRRVDMAPIAGVVDQQHGHDREAAEGVERELAPLGRRIRRPITRGDAACHGAARRRADAVLHSTFFPKFSGTLISAVIAKLGMVATSTQTKNGT
jgi:hypothetical protein